MDVRSYLTLEAALGRRLKKDWRKKSSTLLTSINRLLADGSFDEARKLVDELDLSTVSDGNQKYIRYLLQACALFGSGMVSAQPTILFHADTSDMLDQVTSNFTQYLTHSGTANLRKEALQLIARVESEEAQVQKADQPDRYVKPFVSFDELGDDQLMLVSSLNTSRLSTWGFAAEAEVLGLTRYRLSAVLDGRTSTFCRWINGKEFDVKDAREKVNQALKAQDPDDLKLIQPWPNQSKAGMEAIMGMDEAGLVQNSLHIPPYHPGCRTLCVKIGASQPRLKKPVVPPASAVLPESITSQKGFEEIGISLTPAQVDHWNAYVGVSPVSWLSKLTGADALKVLDGVFGKNAIKILKDGDIITSVKGISKGTKYAVGTVFDPFTGKMYLSKAELVIGDAVGESKFLKTLMSNVIEGSTSLGASSLTVAVGVHAFEYAQLGFLPGQVQWATLRGDLMDRLTEGDLMPLLASLTDDRQQLLLNLLNNPFEGAAGVLADLPWSFKGQPIGMTLLDGITGDFVLDLSSEVALKKAKGYLK